MGELWLSSDDDPANKVLACYTPGPVSLFFFTAYPEQKSETVTLVAGLAYYFEVRVCANPLRHTLFHLQFCTPVNTILVS
jgi:hypothetical protein